MWGDFCLSPESGVIADMSGILGHVDCRTDTLRFVRYAQDRYRKAIAFERSTRCLACRRPRRYREALAVIATALRRQWSSTHIISSSLRRRGPFLRSNDFAIRPPLLPKPQRNWKRIDVERLPPGDLVARAMKFAVMDPANRNDEFVAHSASHCPRLRKREVMWI